jgi:hypothetical protein
MKKGMFVQATLIEPLLGSASGSPDIHREFIASKAPDAQSLEEEVAAIGAEKVIEKTMTVFPRNEKGQPIIWDYQIRGHFKGAAAACAMLEGTLSRKAFLNTKEKVSKAGIQKTVDRTIFVFPRQIIIHLPKGEKIGHLSRPLRGQTAQGERVSIANSEMIPAGSTFDFEVRGPLKRPLEDSLHDLVVEWLNYAEDGGFLQWRNGGFGRFKYKLD